MNFLTKVVFGEGGCVPESTSEALPLDVTNAHYLDDTLPYNSSQEFLTPTAALPSEEQAESQLDKNDTSHTPPTSYFLKETQIATKKRAYDVTKISPKKKSSSSPHSPNKKLGQTASGSGLKIEQKAYIVENTCDIAVDVFATPKWNPDRTPTRSSLRKLSNPSQITPKRSKISWQEVGVYYFDRAQGIDTVPHEGEISLGMKNRHHTIRSFSLNKKGQPYIGIDDEDGELSSDEEEPLPIERNTAKRIQGMSRQQIAKLLKVSGVNVDRSGNRELEILRASRRAAGCTCQNGICLPETCQCAIDGIKCQWDGVGQDYGPCTCDVSAGCENPEGRVEFNQEKVAAHHMATKQRWKDAQRAGIYKAPSRRRLDSADQSSTYCDTPPSSGEYGHPSTLQLSFINEADDVVLPEQEDPQPHSSANTFLNAPKESPRKTPNKLATPTRRQPLRAASLSRLNTPTKMEELVQELPLKLRLRRSASTSAMESPTEEKAKPFRTRRSSSFTRIDSSTNLQSFDTNNFKKLPSSPAVPLNQMPIPTTPSGMLQRSISRIASASRLRPATTSFADLTSVNRLPNMVPRPRPQNETGTPLRMNYSKVQIPSPPPNCFSPDDDSDRPTPLHRFPVTPVYSRTKSSRLTPTKSNIRLHPFSLEDSENVRLTPSKSMAYIGILDAATTERTPVRRLTSSKSSFRLPHSTLGEKLEEQRKVECDLPALPSSSLKPGPSSPRKFPKTSSLLG